MWKLHFSSQLFQNLMPNHLLSHAQTPQQVAQCRYFLLKFLALHNLKPPGNTNVVVYTNTPVAFEGFTSFFPLFQMRDVAVVSDTIVTKARVLYHFLQQHSGAVLYCETATFPLQPLQNLFADIEKGALYLHSPHRYREAELTKALRSFTSPRDHTGTTGATPLQAHTTLWNAVVIGLADPYKELVAKQAREETVNQERLASDYSYTKAFSEAGKIKSAANYIFDYSGFGEFNQLLETFFRKNEEESIPNQVKLLHHIDAAAIQQQKEAYQQQPLFKKWLQFLAGKKWSIKQYENRW